MTLDDLWRALALMAVIEGFVYAVMPDQAKRMITMTLNTPSDMLRMAGLMIAFLGVALLWWLKA